MSQISKESFTTEETVQLDGLFDAGLDSVSKEKAEAIRDAAQKTEQEIKVVCTCKTLAPLSQTEILLPQNYKYLLIKK